ncbi:MAG: hypothetical protein WCP09_02900 [Candidatus Taylorbacteria bacterium]
MTIKNPHSEVTIDELAATVAKGFSEVYSRFDSRFDRLENRVDGIDGLLMHLDQRISNIEENMATKDDIKRLEVRFDSTERILFKDHEPRLRKVERRLAIA